MIVYVITKGEYSDYRIIGVTLEKEKAEELRKLYTKEWDAAYIEIYDTDDCYIENGRFYQVIIGEGADIHVEEIEVVSLGDRNLVWKRGDKYIVKVKAKDEEHAKKIGADLVAKYKAEEQGV